MNGSTSREVRSGGAATWRCDPPQATVNAATTAALQTPSNQRFVADSIRDYGGIPGSYAAGLYSNGLVVEAALEKTDGNTNDKEGLIKAMRAISLPDSPRGPFHFDRFGNAVGDIFIRRCEKKDGRLVNTTIHTYNDVSQFWTYDETWFLSQPVYNRDYPSLKG